MLVLFQYTASLRRRHVGGVMSYMKSLAAEFDNRLSICNIIDSYLQG